MPRPRGGLDATWPRLDAITGQAATFSHFIGTGYLPGNVTGKNGVAVGAGHGMPRFDQAPAFGSVTRLRTDGEPTNQDSENVVFDFPLRVGAISLFWRVFPGYSVNQNLAAGRYGVMIGNATTGGGWLGVRRQGTDWHAVRKRGATEIISVLADATSTFPIDVLVTLSSAGGLQLFLRNTVGPGTIRTGATATDANMAITTETWGGGQLSLCGVQGLIAPGGSWYHETVKVARGVKTFAQIDLMS